MITFLELRIQKKSEKRPQKWARNSDPFLVPLSIGIFPEGSENGRILGPAFWCWRTTFELIFGIAQSGRGATISSATCSRRTPKCSQLMLALNTYSFQTIKLKTCCILTKRSANRGGPLWCTRFRRVFRSRKWAREIGQKPGEDVVWQRNAGRRQPPPQAHFISPNPPRHSRKSVSDGVIQLRVPLAGCAGFFLQAPIPRRILTKMSEAICCMNMRFAKRSWEHPCF